jgi:hypothetical protein
MINIQYEIIQRFFAERNWRLHDDPYRVNLIGIRASNLTGLYDDTLIAFFFNRNKDVIWRQYPYSSKPTGYWLLNPMKKEGCAIVKDDEQYLNLWTLGEFKDRNALLQRGAEIKVFRDKTGDLIIDRRLSTIEEGWFGIHLHRLWESHEQERDKTSAGCQVIDKRYLAEIWDMCKLDQRTNGTKRFDYTLIRQRDLIIMMRSYFGRSFTFYEPDYSNIDLTKYRRGKNS